jgi:hypothetical protein
MGSVNLRIQLSLLIYLVTITTVLYSRSTVFYKKDGSLKEFGTGGKGKTLLPLWLVILLLALLSYFLSYIVLVAL